MTDPLAALDGQPGVVTWPALPNHYAGIRFGGDPNRQGMCLVCLAAPCTRHHTKPQETK